MKASGFLFGGQPKINETANQENKEKVIKEPIRCEDMVILD